MEWPETESELIHYWLSTLPAGTALRSLINIAMMRWRIDHAGDAIVRRKAGTIALVQIKARSNTGARR